MFIGHYMTTALKEEPFIDATTDNDQLRYENYLRSIAAERTSDYPGTDGKEWFLFYRHGDAAVDFSTFYSTPQRVSFDAVTSVYSPERQSCTMTLWTYAAATVWVNGAKALQEDVPVYKPIMKKCFSVMLEEGENEVYVRIQNLGVRDTRTLFSIEAESEKALVSALPSKWKGLGYEEAESFLDGARIEGNELVFPFASSSVQIGLDEASPDIARVKSGVKWVDASGLGSFALPDEYHLFRLCVSANGQRITRLFECLDHMHPSYSGASSWEENFRKKLETIAAAEGLSRGGKFGFYIQCILARKALGIANERDREYFLTTLQQIEDRYDCSDFLVSGVIRYLKNYEVDAELEERIKSVFADYRYWMTMKGSDAMCFWSENHSLLFYSCAMLVGELYPDMYFTRAGMTGKELSAFGRRLTMEWFDDFEAYGYEEFLSTVYMNVTFACLLNIIDYGDEEVSERARKAADTMLASLAWHTFKGVIIAPMGRVYRGVIDPASQGAQSLMNLIEPSLPTTFGEGWLSYYATSSYHFPDTLGNIISGTISKRYSSGNAEIVLEKQNDYILTSASSPRTDGHERWKNILLSSEGKRSEDSHEYTKSFNECFHGTTSFEPGVYGYQQHMWSGALSEEALFFINHPGAESDASSMRPGYWYGNGVMPALRQEGKMLGAVYSIPDCHPVRFIHLFLPSCRFEKIVKDGSWLFMKKDKGYAALWVSSELVPYDDQLHDAEMRVYDDRTGCFVYMGSEGENGSFQSFIEEAKAFTPSFDRERLVLSVKGEEYLAFGKSSDRTQYVEGIRPVSLEDVFSASLKTHPDEALWIGEHQFLLGDVHNHSGISYGHGKLEDAIDFASKMLDFFSVTGHYAWPDMEMDGMNIPENVRAYHKQGFAHLQSVWPEYLRKMDDSESLSLVPFISYEIHSFAYGDYTVLLRDKDQPLPKEEEAGRLLEQLASDNDPVKSGVVAFPHHIGYKTGYRGIDWKRFNENASPFVEIMSMHGSAEEEYPRPAYLHTMGPVDSENSVQSALGAGRRFAFAANTDHHSSSPGSYGSGRTGLWSRGKDRISIWNALLEKRSSALTGDPIQTALFLDGKPSGSAVSRGGEKMLDCYVLARSALRHIEVIKDGRVAASLNDFPETRGETRFIDFAAGWGSRGRKAVWNVTVRVEGAVLSSVSPRLRGRMIVDPLAEDDGTRPDLYAKREGNAVCFACTTEGNPVSAVDGSQGFSMEIKADGRYSLSVSVDLVFDGKRIEQEYKISSEELSSSSFARYTDGFVSPSFIFSREMQLSECSGEMHIPIDCSEPGYVYLRAEEKRGDRVWTTPVWID